MSSPVLRRVHEETFIELVLDDSGRAELLRSLRGRASEVRPTAALIAVVAGKCRATVTQLREAARRLEAEGSAEADYILLELLCHPGMPGDVLRHFDEQGRPAPKAGRRR